MDSSRFPPDPLLHPTKTADWAILNPTQLLNKATICYYSSVTPPSPIFSAFISGVLARVLASEEEFLARESKTLKPGGVENRPWWRWGDTLLHNGEAWQMRVCTELDCVELKKFRYINCMVAGMHVSRHPASRSTCHEVERDCRRTWPCCLRLLFWVVVRVENWAGGHRSSCGEGKTFFDTGFLFWRIGLVGPADDGVVVAGIMPIMMLKSWICLLNACCHLDRSPCFVPGLELVVRKNSDDPGNSMCFSILVSSSYGVVCKRQNATDCFQVCNTMMAQLSHAGG